MNMEILPVTYHNLRTEKGNPIQLEKSAITKSANAVQIVIVMKILPNLNVKVETISEELAIALLKVILWWL